MDSKEFARVFTNELQYTRGVAISDATAQDKYIALVRTLRRPLIDNWQATQKHQTNSKVVAYLSAEYLLGPQTGNALLATELEGTARTALASLGLDLDELIEHEIEPGWDDWLRASLIRLPPKTLPPLVTESDTTTESSGRPL